MIRHDIGRRVVKVPWGRETERKLETVSLIRCWMVAGKFGIKVSIVLFERSASVPSDRVFRGRRAVNRMIASEIWARSSKLAVS